MRGIYIHIPFCIQKCNYCDFCSYPSLISRQDEYCEALSREIKGFACEDMKIDTIYFGGGTPSLLSVKNFDMVLSAINSSFNVCSDAEITVEVNPCTVDSHKAEELRRCGFNRVSIGAQSFVDNELKILGRLHSSDDIVKSFGLMRTAGFDNISLDLMYAIPGQDFDSLSTSVSRLLKLRPEHISCYGLKIEYGTPFYKMLSEGKICEKSDDEYAEMYGRIIEQLSQNGYLQYEISNFSQKGFESKHNLKYWLSEEYLGFGASAASYYRGRRYTHTSDIDAYMNSFENSEDEPVTTSDMMSEYMFLSLRLTSIGASKDGFYKRFGKNIKDVFGDSLNKHISLGTIEDRGDRYILSPKAYFVSNSVLCDFI